LQLVQWQHYRLRIGSRNRLPGAALVEDLPGAVEWVGTDAHDARSLERFCAGCDAVVNCAGSTGDLGRKIALAALASNAHLVDASGYAQLNLPLMRQTVLLAAGMYPGLSGLLPRFLASQGFDTVHALNAYIGGCDRVTHLAAAEYLSSLSQDFGEPEAAWIGGRRVSRALTGTDAVMLPFFPRPVMLHPYLTQEAERLGTSLGLADIRYYSVFDGRYVPAALPAAASRQDADAFVRAAEMDLFGREPYQTLLFEMHGSRGGLQMSRSLLLKAKGGAQLTGIAAATAVKGIMDAEVPLGEHYFAEVMQPEPVVASLEQADAVLALEIFDGPLGLCEEGEI
jgi:hypothetical protein